MRAVGFEKTLGNASEVMSVAPGGGGEGAQAGQPGGIFPLKVPVHARVMPVSVSVGPELSR